MAEKIPFNELKEKFILSCKTGNLDTVKEFYPQLSSIQTNSHNIQIFQHNFVTGLYESIEFKHWDIAQYLIEQNSNELSENGCLDTEELLYISCSRNQVKLTRYLLNEHKVENFNFNSSFKAALSSESLEVLKLLIFEYNLEKNDTINQYLEQFTHIGKQVDRMFEARDLGISLEEQLKNSEEHNKTNKKIKI